MVGALKMEAVGSSKMLVTTYVTLQCHNPDLNPVFTTAKTSNTA
jgi:hypothetical protein